MSVLYLSGALVMIAFGVALVRVLLGPTLADRVVALDLMATIAASAICLYAMISDRYILTDAAMVLVLILFLGTIAFAYYLEKKGSEL